MNAETCRGIKDAKFWQSLVSGRLSKMIEAVNSDPELVLQFRNNYMNVYYHSGSVAKISSERSVDISENYFISCDKENYIRNKEKQTEEDKARHKALIKRRDEVKDMFYAGNYKEYFNMMKDTMDKHWSYCHHDIELEDEGDVQQKLCALNQYESKGSRYAIIDLEHEVSINADFAYKGETPFPKKDKKGNIIPKIKPRFDIVAVDKKTGQLFIWELKKGIGALEGPSGMHDHVDSYIHTVKENQEAERSFVEEIEHILMQKQILGLVDKRIKIDMLQEVQFGFVYSYSDEATNATKQQAEKEIVESLRREIRGGISIADYPMIYLKPKDYTLK